MLVVEVAVVVVVNAELLVDVFEAAVKFVSMKIIDSFIVESLVSVSNVKRESAERKINNEYSSDVKKIQK